jgi:hypothetical protein
MLLSSYTPPATITFTEMQIPSSDGSATRSGASSKDNLCSACANLEGEQKTACLTALKCE